MPAELQKQVPKGARTPAEQSRIATRVRDLIQAGIDQKGEAPDWWARVEKDYRNEPPSNADKPADDYVNVHIPFSQPRQDMLTANVCGVISGQEPLMIARDFKDSSRKDRKEKAVHFFWQIAKFGAQIRKASTDCTNTNKCIYKLTFVDQPYELLAEQPTDVALGLKGKSRFTGVKIDVIHPDDFVCAPAGSGGIMAAVLVGNRVYKRVAEIQQKQDLGVYFKVELGGDESPDTTDTTGAIARSGATQSPTDGDPKNDRIQCYDCIVKLPARPYKINRKHKGTDPDTGQEFTSTVPEEGWEIDFEKGTLERYYRVTVDFNSPQLLDIEEYGYTRPWYFDGYYLEERFFWPTRSIGRNLSPLQDAYNKYHSQLYNGSMMEMAAPIFGSDLPDKYTKFAAFDVVDSESQAQPWSPTLRLQSAPVIFNIIQNLERVGDMVARVSQNAMGAAAPRKQTATEGSIINAGVQVGIEDYIGNFSAPFPEMADFTCELLVENAPLWMQLYADVLEVQYPDADPMGMPIIDPLTGQPQMRSIADDLAIPTLWEVNGKTPGNTPAAQAMAAERLMMVAANPQSGLKIYELAKVMLKTSGLAGADNIQMTEQEMALLAQQQITQGMVDGGGGAGGEGDPAEEAFGPPEEGPESLPNRP